VDEVQAEGVHSVVWDGRDEAGQEVGSGVYFYRLEVPGQFAAVRQMALVR
jgi:flagellar hook assembly protein FlgD